MTQDMTRRHIVAIIISINNALDQCDKMRMKRLCMAIVRLRWCTVSKLCIQNMGVAGEYADVAEIA